MCVASSGVELPSLRNHDTLCIESVGYQLVIAERDIVAIVGTKHGHFSGIAVNSPPVKIKSPTKPADCVVRFDRLDAG